MGNFSRDTFDLTKRYVAVRLEQGVPLVDADWNELQDVTRFELYEALLAAAPNVAQRSGLALAPAGAGNDLTLSAGVAVVGGRPLVLSSALQYSTQRYANAATAAHDSVAAVTPIPLTQPGGARTDAVYLDVFEREVTSAEDANLINGAIGIETSTRLKREVALRVAEGAAMPGAPAGHTFLQIAQLNRTAGPLSAPQIQDTKPYALPLGAREASFPPLVVPASYYGTAFTSWNVALEAGGIRAHRPATGSSVIYTGVIPIAIPDGATITQFRLRGSIAASGYFYYWLGATKTDGSTVAPILASGGIAGPATPLDRVVPLSYVVDDSTQAMSLFVYSSGTGAVDLYGGSITYVP
jgi:hypothetical protein